jgi:hypothetical protein
VVSKADGELRIEGVPPGDYLLKVWHERAPESTLKRLERKITIDADLALPPVRISESGYLEVPHKNKHGKDYPPVEENILYPGGRK